MMLKDFRNFLPGDVERSQNGNEIFFGTDDFSFSGIIYHLFCEFVFVTCVFVSILLLYLSFSSSINQNQSLRLTG